MDRFPEPRPQEFDTSGKSPAYPHRRKMEPASGDRSRAFLDRVMIPISADVLLPPRRRRACSSVPPQFCSPLPSLGSREMAMKKLLVALVIAGSFISADAMAQGRAGDAAIGAVSGAVVLGPVGAVAGAVIGFTAGPSISNALGVGRSAPRPRAQRESQASIGTQSPIVREPRTAEQAMAKINSPTPVKPAETPSAKPANKNAPPVQGFD